MKKVILLVVIILCVIAAITCNKTQPITPTNNPILISVTIDSQTSEIKRVK